MVLLNCAMTPAQKMDLAMCEPGYYASLLMTNNANPCIPCSRCQPGYYQISSCNATDDTMCAVCPTNTYSNGWTSLSVCKPCKVCGIHQLSDPCTPKKDTLCRTKCSTGYYFDTVSHRCKQCSLCPDTGVDRVYECTQHEGSGNYQCREESFIRARRINPSIITKDNSDGMTDNLSLVDKISTDTATTHFLNPEEHHPSPTAAAGIGKVDVLMSTIAILQSTGSISTKKLNLLLPVLSSSTSSPTRSLTAAAIGHQSSSTFKRGLTANDILIVIGIIAASCVVSFVTTYVTCYFLIKRGIVKGGDATVGFARGREPVKGWLAVPRGDVLRNIDALPRRTSIDMI
nr:tumor necrosis factor receptor superfamily member 16-like [Lytechinus pictus]